MDENLLKKFGLDVNKVIHADNGETHYDGDIDFRLLSLTEIPIKFDKVFGDFTVSGNKLKSLENSPKFVGGDFRCGFNLLESLDYSPIIVSKNFYCPYNNLISLDGIPRIIGKHAYFYSNPGNFTWRDIYDAVDKKNGRIDGLIYSEDVIDDRYSTSIYINGKFNPAFNHLLEKKENNKDIIDGD
jgi:hypothetical protein